MDDRNFDNETALQWIDTIEASKTSIRDNDIYPMLRSWFANKQISNILEIGSGQGICSDKIDLSTLEYTGVEPSPKLIDRANQMYNSKNRKFILGNIYSLPFPNNSFDGCFSILVWHLLSDLNLANQELSRVLSSNGHFFIVTVNPAAQDAWKAMYTTFKMEGIKLVGTQQLYENKCSQDILYFYNLEDIMSSLKRAGLIVEMSQTFRMSSKENVDMLLCLQGYKV